MRSMYPMTAALLLTLAGCDGSPKQPAPPKPAVQKPGPSAQAPAQPAADKKAGGGGKSEKVAFTPPPESEMPKDQMGELIKLGHNVFVDTQTYAKGYVGNGLNCANCHLDAGRKADSAPLWAAYVEYPQFRKKNNSVSDFQERVQGCFKYSMNGKAPDPGSPEIKGLLAYSYWLAQGAPTGKKLAGGGYPKLPKPKAGFDVSHGEQVYAANCAVCHGAQGEGMKQGDKYAFPPLWGNASFNWGAGMHQIDNAAAFIKANMPLGRGNTLSDQDAWDVAAFVMGHERPQDPRYKGNVAETTKKYHDHLCLYGDNAHSLDAGAQAAASKPSAKP